MKTKILCRKQQEGELKSALTKCVCKVKVSFLKIMFKVLMRLWAIHKIK